MKDVTSDEITTTVFAIPLSKSPGPDGYTAEFLRSSWSIVGNNFVAAVQEFFRKASKGPKQHSHSVNFKDIPSL